MGQYKRSWSGIAQESPDRFSTLWSVYSLGGRGSVVVTPLALQIGIFNLSLFGNVGVVAQVPVKGLGSFGYEATTSGAQLYLAGGLRMAFAL